VGEENSEEDVGTTNCDWGLENQC